jgi:antitoxin component of RelBE/YafQ-DinJ toxin-antitoxin module
MAETTVIVRVEDELKAAFTQAAKAADRTASQLLRDFMRDYVREQAEHEQVEAWLRHEVVKSVDEYRANPGIGIAATDTAAALDARLHAHLAKNRGA